MQLCHLDVGNCNFQFRKAYRFAMIKNGFLLRQKHVLFLAPFLCVGYHLDLI